MAGDPLKSVVFYSWQSDAPAETNRQLIEEALHDAAKAIRDDESIAIEPVIDRDTTGMPGAVDIATAVFSKISRADAFVADVSLVGRYLRQSDGKEKTTPNPNVLVELGYAVAHLSWERVVLVFNEASGDFSHLPFDINRKKLVPYNSRPGDADHTGAREALGKKLEQELREILTTSGRGPDVVVAAIERGATDRIPLLRKTLSDFEEHLANAVPKADGDRAAVTAALGRTLPVVERISRFCMAATDVEDQKVLTHLYDWTLKVIVSQYVFRDDSQDSRLDYYRFLGHEILTTIIAAPLQADRWDIVDKLLSQTVLPDEPIRDRHRQNQIYDFHDAEQTAWTLRDDNDRAHLLNERHVDGPLAVLMPIGAFAAADYLLFLRTRFEDASSFWRPWSAIFMGGPPPFLIRSKSAAVAERVADVIGASDVNDLKTRLRERAAVARQLFDGGYRWDPLAYFEIDQIATRA